MPSLTLKNIPDDLMEQLREVAEQERRSITQQVFYMLEQSLARKEEPAPEGNDKEEETR